MPLFLDSWTDLDGAQRARALFAGAFGGEPDGVWASPGRVNLIGEHTDYNAGLCLPIALPHRTYVAVHRRQDDVVRMVSSLSPHDIWSGTVADLAPGRVRSWPAYTGGPAWSLAQDGHGVGGFDVAVDSCVPLGAGLSSSAALECAMILALNELFAAGIGLDDAGRARLAALAVLAENEVAGAPTGGMDQAASLRSTEGHALLLDARDSSVAQVPFDLAAAGLALLVIDTRAPHSLNDGQYAARRATCEAAAAELGLASLREVTDLDAALAALTDETSRRRIRHVVTEIRRVEAFVDLVAAGRFDEVGPLMDASHASLRDDYEVSCPELDAAVAAAGRAGALGARMTGGGFGGSAIALIPADKVAAVADAVAAEFAERGFNEPAFLTALAGRPGERVS